MKFSATLLTSAALLGLAAAAPKNCRAKRGTPKVDYVSGFNLGHQKHTQDGTNGQCKDAADWRKEFADIKSWAALNPDVPKAQFNAVKLFSTGDCNVLATAVPEAIAAGIKIWVGVWNVPETKYAQDKAALEEAIKQYGTDWIAGINVGSESLYREEIAPSRLAEQIYEVKKMVQVTHNAPTIAVGTADTWTSWENGNDNQVVFDACDVIVMNGFPYWQDAAVTDGLTKFKDAIETSRSHAGPNKIFVIGETGWPTAGPARGPAIADLGTAKSYWESVGCWLVQQDFSWFWFSGYDEPAKDGEVEQNFGITYFDGTPKVNLNMKEVCGL